MAETAVGTLIEILQLIISSILNTGIKVLNLFGLFVGQINLGVQLGVGSLLIAVVIILIIAVLLGKFIFKSIKTIIILFVLLLILLFVFGAFI